LGKKYWEIGRSAWDVNAENKWKYKHAACDYSYYGARILEDLDKLELAAGDCNYAGARGKEFEDEVVQKRIRAESELPQITKQKDHPRLNYYRYQYGKALCATDYDCEKGLDLMYQAAKDEYEQNGIEGFDSGIAEHLAEGQKAAGSDTPEEWRFFVELRLALYESKGAGRHESNIKALR
jgi:hypothetical protein